MSTGTIKKIVHLSQQKRLTNCRLVPDHNDTGYGVIEARDGLDVYFPHEAINSRHGFDNLRRGQTVEYSLGDAPYLRAMAVRPTTIDLTSICKPAA